jgi:hypothetical protein
LGDHLGVLSTRRTPNCALAGAFRGLLAVWTIAGGLLGASAIDADAQASAPGASRLLSVAIDPTRPGPAVPADFIGLSFEVKSLAQIGALASTGDLAGLLRTLGRGVIRFGGVTADTQVAWSPDPAARPAWATTTVSAADFAGIARLAQETNWRVLLAVNLGHYDPAGAADEVRAARAALGPSLAGVELGNEADSYAGKSLRSMPWTYPSFLAQVDEYRTAIETAAPDVPLAGPDAATGQRGMNWLSYFSADERPSLLTSHYYPLSSCAGYLPLLQDILSPGIHGAETRMLNQVAAVSQRTGIPLRIDETNNVSCGGEAGVSNTFASALWALDYLTRAMSAGIAGVNFHGNPGNPLGYAPVAAASSDALVAGNLGAQPEYYALLLAHMLTGERPLPVVLRSPDPLITVAAFADSAGRLHLLVIDQDPAGSQPVLVRVSLPGRYLSGSVLRLTGPSVTATAGVRLGGSPVSPGGTWAPLLPVARVMHTARGPAVLVNPGSAVLASLLPGR